MSPSFFGGGPLDGLDVLLVGFVGQLDRRIMALCYPRGFLLPESGLMCPLFLLIGYSGVPGGFMGGEVVGNP